MSKGLTDRLKDMAKSLGFNMVGITEARPGRRLDAYHRWLASEYHGRMGYMARPDRVARRRDLNVILPGVNAIISVGLDYGALQPPEEMAADPSRGRISNYAWGVDYHDVMTPRLEALANWLQLEAHSDTSCRAYVDTGAILERDHAQSAGLGFTGKNTMLIGPRSGSWFFLGEVLSTAELVPDEPAAGMPGCGTCHRCLDACPTDAFPQPYVLDARRCISYLTIELKSWISPDLRPLMGNWIFGCDICQVVCPFNRFASNAMEPAFRPVNWDAATPRLVDVLSLDERSFRDHFGRSPISRIKRRGLLRNAAVAAGNWGSPEVVPPLSRLLSDLEPIIRGHAAWGLGRIDGLDAKQALSRALATEADESVRQEIEAALGR